MALVLPCHVRDAHSTAFHHILAVLRDLPWIAAVIVGLDGDDTGGEVRRDILHRLPGAHVLSGGREPGKGRNLRHCLDYAAEMPGLYAAAVHDCDILTYDADFAARLCWPVLCPDAGWTFSKGAYHRVSDRLHGRLTRLMFRPLVAALRAGLSGKCDAPDGPWLDSLSAWHYPLAGECCATMEFWRQCPLAEDWGVEVSILRHIYQTAPEAFGQVELCAAYDHRHHELSPQNPAAGLHRSAREVAAALLRTLQDVPDDLEALFRVAAGHALHQSRLTARLNGLEWDEAAEVMAVETFAACLH